MCNNELRKELFDLNNTIAELRFELNGGVCEVERASILHTISRLEEMASAISTTLNMSDREVAMKEMGII